VTKFVVYGHTGVVGGQLYRWLRERGEDVAGVSLDRKDGDASNPRWAFLCLPTLTREDGGQDIDAIRQVCGELHDTRVVIRSTVLPGTTDRLAWEHQGLTFYHWPEFLSARTAWADFTHPRARFVGCDMRPKSIAAWQAELDPILPELQFNYDRMAALFTTTNTSEMIKYAHNAHGAMQVIYANQIYDACILAGASWGDLLDALPMLGYVSHEQADAYWSVWKDDKRGYGGTCFPKDVGALRAWLGRHGQPSELLDGMEEANARLRGVTQ